MRAAVKLFIVAVICVTVAWWVSLLPGSFTATISGTTLETSTPMALTILAAVFVVIYAVIRLLAWLASLPRQGRNWGARRDRARGDVAVNRALVALAANDAGGARREAERSRRLLGDTPLTLLLAAQAGRQAGRDDEADAVFRRLAETKDGRLLGLRGLLRGAMQRRDWPEATRLATEAERVHPGAAWLRDERRFMAVRTGNWREALRLAGPAQKGSLAVAAAEAESDKGRALDYARQAFEADPGMPQAAVAYARRLRGVGRERPAQDVLRRGWAARPHPAIAEAYVTGTSDKLARAREMAVLVRSNPDNVESYVAIAKAALDAGLTSEARRHLERARAAGINERRIWQLFADVAAMDGNAAGVQDAMRRMQDADPDPVWRCTNCGAAHGRWHPVCDTCGATGTISWGSPDSGGSPGSWSSQGSGGTTPRLLLGEPEVVAGLTS